MMLRFANGEDYDVRLDRVEGRMCTLRVATNNKEFKAAAGTRMQIIGSSAGKGWYLALKEPCKCCGLSGRIFGIPWRDVVIDGAPPKPPTKAAIDAAFKLGGQPAADELRRKWKRRRYWGGDEDADE